MTLQSLLKGVAFSGTDPELPITSVSRDSRQVEQDSVFFCIQGEKSDGHDYAQQALELGAAAIVVQRDLGLPKQVLVEDSHEAYGIACANFFGNPSRSMTVIGVTGTNGKTTTTILVKQILAFAGYQVGLIGTIQGEIGDMVIPAKHTTPDPYQLQAILARMRDAGCTHVVMEVSSHALDQKRVAGMRFAAAAFTNLTQDHLDYHGDMEHYYGAKKKLFDLCDTGIINVDDPYGRRLAAEAPCPIHTFSLQSGEGDYTAHNIRFNQKGSHFALLVEDKLLRVSFAQPGLFSVANAMTAAGLCIACGLPVEQVVEGLGSCQGAPGRIEILPTNTPYTVIRDYAHSPDGLEKVISTVKEFAPARVVTLFGCAGNRDRTKRPMMGEIVARFSDFCILTSDNPRDEDPQQIIDDTIPGLKEHDTPYIAIVNRYEAIQWALNHCQPDDILILAGKGHEDYQVLDYGTIHFDEREIVLELLGITEDKETR